jgi:signal transduction histidine kinase
MHTDARVERPTRTPGRRSLNRSLLILVSQIAILAGITVVLSTPDPEIAWGNLIVLTVAAGYVATGVWAWTRRPTNPVGALIVAAGAALVLGNLSNSENVILQIMGLTISPIAIAVCIHLLLIFPGGRLMGWLPRVITYTAYASILLLQLAILTLQAFIGTGAPSNDATSASTGIAAIDPLQDIQGWEFLLIQIALLVVLTTRLVRARPPVRRLLAPLYVYGMFAVVFVPQMPLLDWPVLVIFTVQLLLLAGVPVMFVVSVVRGGFAQDGAIDVGGASLPIDSTGHKELTLALVRLLGDPTARVLLWSAGTGELRGLDGVPDHSVVVDASDAGAMFRPVDDDFAIYVISQGDETLGAIIYSDRLVNDRDVLDVAGRLVGAAILRILLTERLLRSEKELRKSRARVLAAADGAREQIAQNLHDSVQMRLVVLSMDAGTLAGALNERMPPDPATIGALHDAATSLRRDIDTTAAELRDLVHEVMPPLLTERGLGPAIVALVDRAPITADVEIGAAVDEREIMRDVQRTLYFVAAESLTNVFKHSNASRLSVSLHVQTSPAARRSPHPTELVLEVVDDGIGFDWMSATTHLHRVAEGSNLQSVAAVGVGVRGIIDRVEAVNGHVEFSTVAGGGTRVKVRIPCES